MSVQIRPLRPDDISFVTKIDRQAFPTLWPPTPFKREMNNSQAKYLVAWEPEPNRSLVVDEPESEQSTSLSSRPLLDRLLGAVKGRLASQKTQGEVDSSIFGFVGLWFMAEQAHIISIAVEESSRGKGIGELLLIGSIELAMNHQASVVSLEVRVSNYVAKSHIPEVWFPTGGYTKGLLHG